MGESDKTAVLRLQEATAVAEAVQELAKLRSREVRAQLDKFMKTQMPDEPLSIAHSDTFLNNRDPLFWFSCFVRLFPRGDCCEIMM